MPDSPWDTSDVFASTGQPPEPADPPGADADPGSNGAEAASGDGPRDAQRAGRAAPTARQARKIASRALALDKADPATRRILAVVCGCEDNPVDITVSLSCQAPSWMVCERLARLRSEGELAAATSLMRAGDGTRRAMWAMARALGVDIPARYPADDITVAEKLVPAVRAAAPWDQALAAAKALAKA